MATVVGHRLGRRGRTGRVRERERAQGQPRDDAADPAGRDGPEGLGDVRACFASIHTPLDATARKTPPIR